MTKQQAIQKTKLPEGWKIVKLGDIVDLIKGKKPKSFVDKFKSNAKPYILISSFGEGNQEHYTDDEKCKECYKDDVLIVWDGARAGLSSIGQEGYLGSTIVALRQREKVIAPELLYYFINNHYDCFNKQVQGTGIPHLKKDYVANLQIPLPPLPTQKLIVQKLNIFFEKYNKLKEEKQKAKENYERILGSVISSLIPSGEELPNGWEMKKLGILSKITSGGTPLRNKQEYWKEGTIPWLKSGELKDNEITKVEENITEKGLKNSSAKYFDSDTVLIALYGATVGKTAILKVRSTTNQAVCGISPDKGVLDYEYLFYFLLSKRKYLIKKSFGGAQPNISQTIIKNLQIPLPNVNIQKNIVKKIKEVKQKYQKISEEQDKIEKWVKELPKSVLSRTFKGELV